MRALLLAWMLVGCAKTGTVETGVASWYGPGFAGRPTASGEPFRPARLTAAHPRLAFGTVVRVTRTDTGQSVRVVINDRGPFVAGRVIDLSRAAARRLDLIAPGLGTVRIEIVGCRTRYDGC